MITVNVGRKNSRGCMYAHILVWLYELDQANKEQRKIISFHREWPGMETPVCSPGKRVDQYEWDTVSFASENALLFEHISHVLGFPRILYQESASKFT